jgi:glycosyltransferase involved in cell wall biosynthesis
MDQAATMRSAMGSPRDAIRPPGPIAGEPGCSVVHLLPSALGRGAQVFARALADRLGGPAEGHELFCLFEGDSEVEVERTTGLHGGVDASSGFRPVVLARLSRELRRASPDIVVAHGGDPYKYALLATSAPIVYHAIGTLPESACRGPRRLLWRLLVRRAALVVAVSDDVASQYRRVLGVDPRRIVVAPNGRDPARFRPADVGPDGGTVKLLFVGRLTAGKRPERFIELVRALREAGLPVHSEMVGEGPMRPSLEQQAASAGVEMLGRRDDVAQLMQRADLFVFPSAPEGEGMPGVLIEAGLSGLAVVATDVAGVSAVVSDAETGVIVPIDDFGRLVSATADLVKDPARRRAMGVEARAKCTEQFSIDVAAERWRVLLAEVMANRVRWGESRPRRSERAPARSG